MISDRHCWKRAFALFAAAVLIGWPARFASAAILFGTDRADGYLYRVDTSTLETTLVTQNLLAPPSVSGFDPNGNATDLARGLFYYTRDTPGRLFVHDLFTDQSADLGALTGSVSSGAFYDNAYYYIPQSTGSLRRVTFDAGA